MDAPYSGGRDSRPCAAPATTSPASRLAEPPIDAAAAQRAGGVEQRCRAADGGGRGGGRNPPSNPHRPGKSAPLPRAPYPPPRSGRLARGVVLLGLSPAGQDVYRTVHASAHLRISRLVAALSERSRRPGTCACRSRGDSARGGGTCNGSRGSRRQARGGAASDDALATRSIPAQEVMQKDLLVPPSGNVGNIVEFWNGKCAPWLVST
jgi:hypothetical protein